MRSGLSGVDSGRHPSLLDPAALAFGVNVTMRGGFPMTRPRLSRKTLQFAGEEIQDFFENNPLQGYTRTGYRTTNKTLIVVSVGGRIFSISPQDDFMVSEITPTNGAALDVNIPNLPLTWLEQVEEFLVIQNEKDRAIIFDGATSRRAAPDEVPVGSAMAYNEEIGRFCVAVNGNEVAIGDVVGGPTSVLKFTETGYLNEGGRFRIPRKYGRITGMSMIANLDRSNGQGAMIVFAEEGFSVFNLPPNRDTWKNLNYPVQINMPIRYSATSQNGIVLVNGDVYYQAKDGLRTFLFAIRDFQQPGNVPISSEMDRVTQNNTQRLLKHASTILFDNRILFTVNPAPSGNGVYHRAICGLDLNLISRLGQKASPAYEGIWTGIRPTGMMTGSFEDEERAFIFALNPDTDANELWELHRKTGFDNTESRISSAIETRAMLGNGIEMNKLQNLEVWIDQIVGTVNIGAQWRPDSYPCWFPFCSEKEVCVANEDCSTPEQEACKPLAAFNPGYRTRLNFGQPPDTCEALDNKPARLGYEFQFRIYWSGQCRIRRVLAKVNDIVEEVFPRV